LVVKKKETSYPGALPGPFDALMEFSPSGIPVEGDHRRRS
jgi:hypothetical protein